jgi:hypothetical protein
MVGEANQMQVRHTVVRPSMRLGVWRAVVTLPDVVGSTLLMLMLLGWAGHWEPLLMLGWVASGLAVITPVGERAAVWFGCGFRPLSATGARAARPTTAGGSGAVPRIGGQRRSIHASVVGPECVRRGRPQCRRDDRSRSRFSSTDPHAR